MHYTGSQWRFHEIDFIERSCWGLIEGTGFADWPITSLELEPYFVKAEYELGFRGWVEQARLIRRGQNRVRCQLCL